MAKMRSPNYPAYSLKKCVEWVGHIWKKEGRTVISPEIAAVAAGYKGLSGPSRTAIASLKKFGLLDDSSDGVRVSALALSILHPQTPGEALEATRAAARRPALFAQLMQTHLDASVHAITSYLITRQGFSQIGAESCAEAFQETVQFAHLEEAASEEVPETLIETPSAISEQVERSIPVNGRCRVMSWPLTRGVYAEVSFSDENLTEEDLDLLCAYLNLAKRGLVGSGPKS